MFPSIDLQNLVIQQYVIVNIFSPFSIYKLKCVLEVKKLHNQVIGDNNLIMGACHIAHDCKVGSNNIFANNTLLAGHVLVEVISFLVEVNLGILL